jgi:hypothetical protein
MVAPKPDAAPRRGRKMKFPEKMVTPFPPGTISRMDAVIGDTEDRTDLVRDAVEKELARRERDAREVVANSRNRAKPRARR